MIDITFPDGKVRSYALPVTPLDIAKSISNPLYKRTVAAYIDDVLVDATTPLSSSCHLQIVDIDDPASIDIIRHSAAHLLAQATKQLYPHVKVTIGPVIDDGFYYDFHHPQGFNAQDMQAITKRMQKIVKSALPILRFEMTKDQAIDFFAKQGEDFKVDIIKSLDASQPLSFYRQGDFTDLCRGPHVPNTKFLSAFALIKVAGAYWRGDHRQPMLQRIYGTAFATHEQLKTHLDRIEEAKKRDHRILMSKMQLGHFEPTAAGMVFWHERGTILYQLLTAYMKSYYKHGGYHEVKTPQLIARQMWEASGHWDKFANEMFVVQDDEDQPKAIKPMNCPCHVMIYKQALKSYRDLPYRIGEFGHVHRNEPSGALHGLMRLRSFVQDDGHIFCRESQIQSEIGIFIKQVKSCYEDFGFDDIKVYLSTRPDERIGQDHLWDKAEKALAQALDVSGLPWSVLEGQGAFYGPKIEFSLTDCLNRTWQCGTAQVDFSMPERLDAAYIDEHSQRCRPVMIHRAILGSLERFLAILIEQTAGCLPFWLTPVQLMIVSISAKHIAYAEQVSQALKSLGYRVDIDTRDEKIGFKIRQHSIARLPYLVICGDEEQRMNTISLRDYSGKQLGSMSIEQLHIHLHKQHQHHQKEASTS